MNYLINDFPTTVMVAGKKVPIKWDLDTAIKFERLLKSDELEDIDVVLSAIDLYLPECTIGSLEEQIEAILGFYSMRSDGDLVNPEKQTSKEKIVMDLELDSKYIYAGFLEQYGINLQEENMHWHKFLILLENLGDDMLFSKILKWRSINLNDVPDEQKSYYREMKRIYKLPDMTAGELEDIERLNKILENGGDLSNWQDPF